MTVTIMIVYQAAVSSNVFCGFFFCLRIKGLSRAKVLETVDVNLDIIDIGEPLTGNPPTTIPVSHYSPTATSPSEQNGVLHMTSNGGVTVDERLQGGPMGGLLLEYIIILLTSYCVLHVCVHVFV